MKFLLAASVVSLCMWGCTTLPVPEHSTDNPDVTRSSVYQGVREYTASLEHGSSVHLFHRGVDAMVARVEMIRHAEVLIQAQYYFVKPGLAGDIFLANLLAAAEKGVKVQLLLDDIATPAIESTLLALNSHPNIEIKIYNPFVWRRARMAEMVFGFPRINHRMHNKSLTIDSAITIVGGRNIADEYFETNKELEFADLDLLAVGPVTQQVSDNFNRYWQAPNVIPLAQLFAQEVSRQASLDELAAYYTTLRDDDNLHRYRDKLLESDLARQIENNTFATQDCPVYLVSDPPTDKRQDIRNISANLSTLLMDAERQVIVESPYFVPEQSGVDLLVTLAKKGLDVIVITNSLASNDVALVHSGYAPYRLALLRGGVKIYELKPDAALGQRRKKDQRASLHAKAFAIDQRRLFVGSFNWDPRSLYINTEMGLVTDCAHYVELILQEFEQTLSQEAYQLEAVQVAGEWSIQWRETLPDGSSTTTLREPQVSGLKQFFINLMSLLPFESQL